MNLNESFDVSPSKVEALLARIKRLAIAPAAIEERFIRGGGKGGQKINKTANRVQLRYAPLDLVVRCQKDRRRTVNRFLALRELVDRVEMTVSPGTSERLREFERLRRNKLRRGGRAAAKYAASSAPQP
ncbi:MAG: peptide chain release factor-like protein [Elusimicrobia bacterium]|nr:peptide chain release factor-like protein [Elusimicrobiota bacterium]